MDRISFNWELDPFSEIRFITLKNCSFPGRQAKIFPEHKRKRQHSIAEVPPFQEKKVDGSVMRSLHQARQLRQGHGHCRDVSDQQQAADDGDIVHEHVRQDLFQAGTAHLDADE